MPNDIQYDDRLWNDAEEEDESILAIGTIRWGRTREAFYKVSHDTANQLFGFVNAVASLPTDPNGPRVGPEEAFRMYWPLAAGPGREPRPSYCTKCGQGIDEVGHPCPVRVDEVGVPDRYCGKCGWDLSGGRHECMSGDGDKPGPREPRDHELEPGPGDMPTPGRAKDDPRSPDPFKPGDPVSVLMPDEPGRAHRLYGTVITYHRLGGAVYVEMKGDGSCTWYRESRVKLRGTEAGAVSKPGRFGLKKVAGFAEGCYVSSDAKPNCTPVFPGADPRDDPHGYLFSRPTSREAREWLDTMVGAPVRGDFRVVDLDREPNAGPAPDLTGNLKVDPLSSIRALEEMVKLCIALGSTPREINGAVVRSLNSAAEWQPQDGRDPQPGKVPGLMAGVVKAMGGVGPIDSSQGPSDADRGPFGYR